MTSSRTSEGRISQRFTALVCIALLTLTGFLVWTRMSGPSDTSIVQLSNAPWQGGRIQVHFVLGAGSPLRPRDIVVAIDGHTLRSLRDRRAVAEGPLREGEQFVYTVLRDGVIQDVTVRTERFPVGTFLIDNWSSLLVLGYLLGVSVFIFASRPHDPAANVLLLFSSFAVCGTTSWLLGGQVAQLASGGPGIREFVGEIVLAAVWGAAVHFTLVLPGTELVVTRPRLVVAYSLPFAIHGCYLVVRLFSGGDPTEIANWAVQVSMVPGWIMPVVTAVLMVVSYRSTHDRLAQLRQRWLLGSFILATSALLFGWAIPVVLGWPTPNERLMPLVMLPVSVAFCAAVLRYRLFDIQVILRRSLVYGSLTMCVVTIYLVATWTLGRVIGERSVLVALAATCLVAFSAQSLRDYLHRRVGRLIFGARDDPYEVVSRLGHLDAATAPRALNALVEMLAQTLRLPYVAIELRTHGNEFATAAECGVPQGEPTVLPLTRGHDVVGRLALDVGPGREPFGPADHRLLDALIHQVSGAAAMVLLTAELQRSREQLVVAREEERRRLHHRLHDGLGPDLAANVMHMETAKRLVARDPDRAERMLGELIYQTRRVITEVRSLVYNLRPPALDQLGLAGAIGERANHLAGPMQLRVDIDYEGDLSNLPAAVEVAAFWISVEAVNNVAQHGRATACRVRLARSDRLLLEIMDNGRGLPDDLRSGGGLLSMRERAEELSGTCTVARHQGGGTVVRAELPIRRTEDTP